MPYILLCLAVWLWLKMGSVNMVLVRLLQIGAKDLTVSPLEVQTKKYISYKLAIQNCLLEYLNVSIITIQHKFIISSSNVPALASIISITSPVSVPVS